MKLFTIQQHFETICFNKLRNYLLENMNSSSNMLVSDLEDAFYFGLNSRNLRKINDPKDKVIWFYGKYYTINKIVQLNLS